MSRRGRRLLARGTTVRARAGTPALRVSLLLRLAERHRDPGGVRVEVHRLVDRRGDAAVDQVGGTLLLLVPSESGRPDRRSVMSKEKYSTDSAHLSVTQSRDITRMG